MTAPSGGACDPNDPNAWREALEPASKPYLPHWTLERRTRRMVAKVLGRAEADRFAYDWMTPDDLMRTPEELDATDAYRKRQLENVRHKDGSRVAKLEGIHTPYDRYQARLIRDDAIFAATEWGKLWRSDRLLGNAVLDASLGIRDDGTLVRDWHSPRARATFALLWLLMRVHTTNLRSVGTVTVRGVNISYLCKLLAPVGKSTLHRNTLCGTHRGHSLQNAEVGYLLALELAGVLEKCQYGDRSADAQHQVNEYTIRVTPQTEKQRQLIERNELAYRELLANRWSRLAELEALRVATYHERKRERAQRDQAIQDEIRAALFEDSADCVGPP